MKNIYKVALTILTLLFLGGCMESKQQQLNMPIQQKDKTIKANFIDSISKEPISIVEVKDAIINSINESSVYEKLKKWNQNNTNCQRYEGRYSGFVGNNIEVTYYKGAACSATPPKQSHMMDYISILIPVTIKEDKDNFEIDFIYPKVYEISQNEDIVGNAYFLDQPHHLLSDIDNIFQGFEKIKISRTYSFKDEITSKFNKDSVEDNFKRIQNKINPFYSLTYSVFNYQNGSKVQYEATIKYEIDKNGNIDAGNDFVIKLKNKIKNIVNK